MSTRKYIIHFNLFNIAVLYFESLGRPIALFQKGMVDGKNKWA